MDEQSHDIQLKFDGDPIKKLRGAPAEAVIASLNALQRMVHIIGMRAEGRGLGQRLKPTAKVKREYAVICRAPQFGSHLQPIDIASQSGAHTSATAVARGKLLAALKAFDSGEDDKIVAALPDARERWFLADAAKGLIPDPNSGLRVTLRDGKMGRFAFSADRARDAIERFRAGPVPEADEEEIVGKVQSINFTQTLLVIKPSASRAVRMDYPLQLEPMLEHNKRERLRLLGRPKLNNAGDITSFTELTSIGEVESRLDPIVEFTSGGQRVGSSRPLSIPATFDYESRLFIFTDPSLGIDAYSDQYDTLRDVVLEELDVVWRNYAMAPASELAPDALLLKKALLTRFRVIEE